jgi:hypothetical protein
MNVLDRDQKEAIIRITEYIRTNVDIKKLFLTEKKKVSI